jgi:arylsulfatase A-like enzyme
VQERFGERALILFSADHGEMLGNHGLWGKNNCAYEDVWNVPLLARYPRGAPGAALHGTVQGGRVMLTDVAPTCLRATGMEGAFPTDGLPLEDQVARGGRAHVLAEGGGFLALSDGCTKYVSARRRGPGDPAGERCRELLDLVADPGEHRNVLGHPEYAERHLRLTAALEDDLLTTLLP